MHWKNPFDAIDRLKAILRNEFTIPPNKFETFIYQLNNCLLDSYNSAKVDKQLEV